MEIRRTHACDTVAGDWIEVEPGPANKLVEAGTGDICFSPCSALKILGSSGIVMCVSASGRIIPWSVETGDIIPLQVIAVSAEGTTATGIWALF